MNTYFMRLSPGRLIPVEFYNSNDPRPFMDADGYWIVAVQAEDGMAAIDLARELIGPLDNPDQES